MIPGVLLIALAVPHRIAAQGSDPAKVAEYAKSLPAAAAPVFVEQK